MHYIFFDFALYTDSASTTIYQTVSDSQAGGLLIQKSETQLNLSTIMQNIKVSFHYHHNKYSQNPINQFEQI